VWAAEVSIRCGACGFGKRFVHSVGAAEGMMISSPLTMIAVTPLHELKAAGGCRRGCADSRPDKAQGHVGQRCGARFWTDLHSRMTLSFMPLLRLKRCHA
jgi:hypothetical protein